MNWCPVCSCMHEGSACPPTKYTIDIRQTAQAPIGPNNCSRFIYGQGCHGCHMMGLCWPSTTASVLYEVKP